MSAPWRLIRHEGWMEIEDANLNHVCSFTNGHEDFDLPRATLIAAAPDLLEALKMARKCIAYCRRAHKDAQSGDGLPVEILLDAAIAKATTVTERQQS